MTSAEGSLTSVVLAGGGSAGHVSPLLALADCITARHPQCRITVLGTQMGLESRLVPARGYELRTIPKVPFPRRPNADLVALPVALRRAIRQAADVLEEVEAQAVVGFGGYVSTPAYLAARQRHTPIVVHEQNSRAGLANKLGSRLTKHVATTFSLTRLPNSEVVGMPLRREIADLDRAALRAEGLAEFGLDDARPTLLITGGSLGAQRLNDTFSAAAPVLRAAGVQVLHLTGAGKGFDAPEGPGPKYVVREYADRMDLAFAVADAVVARSGANTVCEISAVGLPAFFVPLPIGNGEQRLNAYDMVEAGAATVTPDSQATTEWVRTQVLPTLTDETALAAMAKASASLGARDADGRLAALVEKAVAGGAA